MIPTASTTVSILRSPLSATRDEWDENPAPTAVATMTGLRAVIWQPAGSEQQTGSTHSLRSARLTCDPCDLVHTDQVLDESTGDLWEVLWVQQSGDAFGLENVRAGLALTAGVAT